MRAGPGALRLEGVTQAYHMGHVACRAPHGGPWGALGDHQMA